MTALHHKVNLLIGFFFASAILFLTHTPAFAASRFNSAIVRLNRTSPSSALSGIICAQPNGTQSEASFNVTFPSSFTINSNPASWTFSTANIPNGTTAWPGTGTHPTAVSGNSISFLSNDLSSGITYCLSFVANGSTVGNSTTGDLSGEMESFASDSSLINVSEYGVSVGNDQVTVNAEVNASPNDFYSNIKLNSHGQFYSQGTNLGLTITYGNLLPYDTTPFKVVASWSRGALQGTPAFVDLLEYIPGSATKAYDNTPAVIDPINRTITWTIPSLPAKLQNQTVSFNLLINGQYQGDQTVNLFVSTYSQYESISSPEKSVLIPYIYSIYAPGYTPPPAPTAAPTVTPTPAPTPVPPPTPHITSVEMSSISPTQAVVHLTANNYTFATIQYGTSLNSLNHSLTDTKESVNHDITLPSLQPNTTYYFKLKVTNRFNKSETSDIYVFKTASTSSPSSIDTATFILTADKNVLYSPGQFSNPTSMPSITLPTNQPYEFHFGLKSGSMIEAINSSLQNSDPNGTTAENIQMFQSQPNYFSGQLITTYQPGIYTQVVKIADFYGNISLVPIAIIHVVPPITILDRQNHNPIEGARIFLSKYNNTTQMFEDISSQMMPIANPSITSSVGIDPLALSAGRYKITVEAIGYHTLNDEFSIGPGTSDKYPTEYLSSKSFSIINSLMYFVQGFNDTISSHLNSYIQNVKHSNRLFSILSLLILSMLVVVTALSFKARAKISLIQTLHDMFFPSPMKVHLFAGKVADTNNKPLSRVLINLIDETNQLIGSSVSDNHGHFSIKAPLNAHYQFLVLKKGFEPLFEPVDLSNKAPVLTLAAHESITQAIERDITSILEELAGGIFELLLVITILFELVFIYSFGILKVLPFITITVLNITLWIRHERRVKF